MRGVNKKGSLNWKMHIDYVLMLLSLGLMVWILLELKTSNAKASPDHHNL